MACLMKRIPVYSNALVAFLIVSFVLVTRVSCGDMEPGEGDGLDEDIRDPDLYLDKEQELYYEHVQEEDDEHFEHVVTELNRQQQYDLLARIWARKVRDVLDKELFAFLNEHPDPYGAIYEFPIACPLRKDRDVYFDQEDAKQKLALMQWRCNLCGKIFRTELYVDQHLSRRHTLEKTVDGRIDMVDLSTYRDIFLPDLVHLSTNHTSTSAYSCDPEYMESLRHRCNSLFERCFPYEANGYDKYTQRLFLQVTDKFCETLRCKDSDQEVKEKEHYNHYKKKELAAKGVNLVLFEEPNDDDIIEVSVPGLSSESSSTSGSQKNANIRHSSTHARHWSIQLRYRHFVLIVIVIIIGSAVAGWIWYDRRRRTMDPLEASASRSVVAEYLLQNGLWKPKVH